MAHNLKNLIIKLNWAWDEQSGVGGLGRHGGDLEWFWCFLFWYFLVWSFDLENGRALSREGSVQF